MNMPIQRDGNKEDNACDTPFIIYIVPNTYLKVYFDHLLDE